MTKSEALQNLAGYNPSYYKNFDYSLFDIPYHELLSDNLLGEDKQVFKTEKGHLLFELMEFRQSLQVLHKSMRKIADSNHWVYLKPHFPVIFNSLDERACNYLKTQYLLVG